MSYEFYRIKTFLKVKKNYELKFLDSINNKKKGYCISYFFLIQKLVCDSCNNFHEH
jgi:hypothetical protein